MKVDEAEREKRAAPRAALTDGDLRLRPLRLPDDLPHALRWYADPEVLRDSEGGADPYPAATIRGMYRCLSEGGEVYVIEIQVGGSWRPIGDATLRRDSLPIVIGDPAHRGKGLGKRVLNLLVERARSLGWNELRVKRIYQHNRRSLRLYESRGFRISGECPDDEGRPCWQLVLPLASP